MTAGKNLIIGAAVGYKEPQIAPFVRSLKRAGYGGGILLIVDQMLAEALRASPEYRHCTILEVPKWIPGRLKLAERNNPRYWRLWHGVAAAAGLFIRLCHLLPLPLTARRWLQIKVAQHCYQPTETRYLHSLLFLLQHPHDRVLLSDVRDVLFQSDPFGQMPARGLAVGMEIRSLTLASEKFNARQISMAYGEEGLRTMGEKPISCCGVTYGDGSAMARYLDLMAREIFDLNFWASLWPMDQALHNFILWTGRFGEFRELDTLAGPIATLAMLDEDDLKLSREGMLLNRDGTIPSVVHQHDRWPKIAAALEQTLAGSNEARPAA